MSDRVIGIDLGETAIELGRFLQDGTCLEIISVADFFHSLQFLSRTEQFS